MTEGEYYALKRFLLGKHKGRYDHKGWRRIKQYKKKNPAGGPAAWNKAYRAEKAGGLTREPCRYCGNPEVEKHHPEGYDKPLVVEWLCQSCHQRVESGNWEALEIISRAERGNREKPGGCQRQVREEDRV